MPWLDHFRGGLEYNRRVLYHSYRSMTICSLQDALFAYNQSRSPRDNRHHGHPRHDVPDPLRIRLLASAMSLV